MVMYLQEENTAAMKMIIQDGKSAESMSVMERPKNQLQCMAILTVAVTRKSMAKMAMDFRAKMEHI
ncbi:MAG: hypothetical protein BHW56_00150 [Acetobacter sp. 46_36]|nr:MAG: hypothetical protein BHW56_00150 [Acetobacter sp. 46_36]